MTIERTRPHKLPTAIITDPPIYCDKYPSLPPCPKVFHDNSPFIDLHFIPGHETLPEDGKGCRRRRIPVRPSLVPCVCGSLEDLPPLQPPREDHTYAQRREVRQARTRLAMEAGVDPAEIIRVSGPPAGVFISNTDIRREKKIAYYKEDPDSPLCVPDATLVTDNSNVVHCGTVNIPFTDYTLDWLASTAHLVFFRGGRNVCVIPTIASPPHTYKPEYDDRKDEWYPVGTWVGDMSETIGRVAISRVHTSTMVDEVWEGHQPSPMLAALAGFDKLNKYEKTRYGNTRMEARMKSPYFTAAYRVFVERTIQRNEGNFVRDGECEGEGCEPHHLVQHLTVVASSYVRSRCSCLDGFGGQSNDDFEFVPVDPLSHIEAMGRSGVASKEDVRDVLRAWKGTEAIEEPPAPLDFGAVKDEPREWRMDSFYEKNVERDLAWKDFDAKGYAQAWKVWKEKVCTLVHPQAAYITANEIYAREHLFRAPVISVKVHHYASPPRARRGRRGRRGGV